VPVTTGPEDRGRLRACHADREQVIGTLQAAFAQGRLTRDELDARAGQALGARTYADLAALTADIPADPAAPWLLARRWPAARPIAKSGWLADREYVIGTLRAAFVHGRLTRDELDARAGQAFAARTYADLAALLADIPGAIRDDGDIPGPPARAPRRQLARAAVKAGSCLIIAAAAVWVASSIAVPGDAGPYPDHPFLLPMLLLAAIAVITAPCILGRGVVASRKLRRSRGQLPPRPGPGGRALEGERRASTGHDPDPPHIRTDQTHADLRAHKSRQGRPYLPAQAGRTPRGARLAPGAV
jgi:hypothetical protein